MPKPILFRLQEQDGGTLQGMGPFTQHIRAVDSVPAPPPPSTFPFRNVMNGILATWSIVTAVPLMASVVIAAPPDPQFNHAARTVETQLQIVNQSQPEPWGAQARPKLTADTTAVPVNDPPFSSRRDYAGEWPYPTWDAQHRPPLPLAITSVPVNDPPFSHRGRTAQTQILVAQPLPDWSVQTRPKLAQPSVQAVDNPPFQHAARTVQAQVAIAQSEAPIWAAHQYRHIVQPGAAVADAPPLLQRTNLYILTQWPVDSWPVQRAARLIPQSIDTPPTRQNWLPVILQQHEPAASPTIIRRVLPIIYTAVPVHDPPPNARRLYQYICSTWQGLQWPTQRRGPVTADGTIAATVIIDVSLHVSQQPMRELRVAPLLTESLDVSRSVERDMNV
jgi:hypothetical protein